MDKNNPLLDFSALPRFNDIKPQHIEPALDYMLEHNRNQIDALLDGKVQLTWDDFIAPMEEAADQLDKMWAPVSHLNSVRDSDELRDVYEDCLPKLVEYGSELGQNKKLFQKLKEYHGSAEFIELDTAQKKSIENELRDFHLSGVDLSEKDKTRYREISAALSELANKFSQNILDATDAWSLHVEDQAELSGLPDTLMQLAEKRAREQEKSGWVFTLQGPVYGPFMTYCNNRALREQMYRAYATRASELDPNAGKWDNSELICQILRLRKERSALLGFKDYASYSVETKMAKSSEEVLEFLRDLGNKSRHAAINDVEELEQFAKDQFGLDELAPWDYAWVSEKLKLDKFDISQEALRPYFPLPKVLAGMFSIVNKLFGIQIKEVSVEQTWHPQIQLFQILDKNNNLRGRFYIDLFARDHKRGGAWMADCIGRRKYNGEIQLPVAFLTCNFTEPVNDQPSLLTHDEVMTLFHEFGHGLHHMLTKIDVASVSGINGVPWDAVELPSQFLENWCWEREALDLISGHFETGEPIPDDMLENMRAAKNFQSAMQMLRQIEFSLFDMNIHLESADTDSPQAVRALLQMVRDEIAVVKVPGFNRFENSFGHIFAGGYAAGYYSYKWAEVLSADAFSLFEENGLFDPETGQSFLENILEKGGSDEPMNLFVQFRGRKPEVDALLRHSGLGGA